MLTLLPVVFGFFGAIYAVVAVGLGAAFIVLARAPAARAPTARSALRTYLFSLAYLAVLFVRDGRSTPGCKTRRAMDRTLARRNIRTA